MARSSAKGKNAAPSPVVLEATCALAGSLLVQGAIRYWRALVDLEVLEPYLDEVFHVGQAQTYCKGEYYKWDPKITTPPGLYMVSQAWMFLKGAACSTAYLRTTSEPFLAFLMVPCLVALLYLGGRRSIATSDGLYEVHQRMHSAVNICLFPPLFFFTGLYYTDVASTVLVIVHLLLCSTFLRASRNSSLLKRLPWYAVLTVSGVITLFFRQTNIFWAAIFPAGLTILESLPDMAISGSISVFQLFSESFQRRSVYDPPVSGATIQDYFLSVISILAAILGLLWSLLTPTKGKQETLHLQQLRLLDLAPFVALLGAFAAFVLWNGGVVLGDKSNHVATIHLPQMLYIWPYIVFFSWPLVAPTLTGLFLPRHLTPSILKPYARTSPFSLASAFFMFVATGVGLVVVHYNTIIHPFTLADNRHYVFYVFRILLRHPYIKYAAVPVYLICGLLTIQSLDIGNTITSSRDKSVKASGDVHSSSTKASVVLVWLATCSLCLVSAPLVEPRYFILPWVIWRLHVASPQVPAAARKSSSITALLLGADIRLWLETLWSVAVNVVTGFLFLHRGFSWPQEPGKVQRFMW